MTRTSVERVGVVRLAPAPQRHGLHKGEEGGRGVELRHVALQRRRHARRRVGQHERDNGGQGIACARARVEVAIKRSSRHVPMTTSRHGRRHTRQEAWRTCGHVAGVGLVRRREPRQGESHRVPQGGAVDAGGEDARVRGHGDVGHQRRRDLGAGWLRQGGQDERACCPLKEQQGWMPPCSGRHLGCTAASRVVGCAGLSARTLCPCEEFAASVASVTSVVVMVRGVDWFLERSCICIRALTDQECDPSPTDGERGRAAAVGQDSINGLCGEGYSRCSRRSCAEGGRHRCLARTADRRREEEEEEETRGGARNPGDGEA